MMSTCKECLSCEMCAAKRIVADAFEDEVAEEWYEVCANACEHFKDKTKYVEQKYGRWNIILSDHDDCELMKCSCCGDEFYDGDNDTVDSLHNYCPNCGAKMDGDTQ